MASSSFKRNHHQDIEQILRNFDPQILSETNCFFGGGTRVALELGEYRLSNDIDFVCSDKDGFLRIRNLVDANIDRLLKQPMAHAREVRNSRDKISTVLLVGSNPIKVEFVREGNIDLTAEMSPVLGIPQVCRMDMFAQKLMANADRGNDGSTLHRDIIDLSMMAQAWGGGKIPQAAWQKAHDAYGDYLTRNFQSVIRKINENPKKLSEEMDLLQIDQPEFQKIIRSRIKEGLGGMNIQSSLGKLKGHIEDVPTRPSSKPPKP